MKRQNYGIDPKTGRHDRRLTATESAFLGILWLEHAGEKNKISADTLACRYAESMGEVYEDVPARHDYWLSKWKRLVRRMQNHLLIEHRHIPLYSKPGINGGYWIGEDEFEGNRFHDSFRKRAVTGFVKAARGKQAAVVQAVEQLSFEFDDLEDMTGADTVSISGRPTPIAVVDALIRKMMSDPERFASDLQRLGKKFSSVLLPKARAREIEDTARKLQELVRGLAP